MTTSAIDYSRRNLLKGRIGKPVDDELRPPWAVGDFTAACNRCGECAVQCQQRIIVQGTGGFPRIDFSQRPCTFCGDCANACKHGALDRQRRQTWSIKARIGSDCLSAKGISCRSCGDVCDRRAINFQPRIGGRTTAAIDGAACNGCGACVSVCPVDAIRVKQLDTASSSVSFTRHTPSNGTT